MRSVTRVLGHDLRTAFVQATSLITAYYLLARCTAMLYGKARYVRTSVMCMAKWSTLTWPSLPAMTSKPRVQLCWIAGMKALCKPSGSERK